MFLQCTKHQHLRRRLVTMSNRGSGLGDRLKDKFISDDKEKSSLGDRLEEKFLQDGDKKFKKEDDYSPTILFKSSEDMAELDDESVHFAITSPPYNTDWDYGSYDDTLDYSTEYLPMLARVFEEVYRVMKPGGRFCINIPSLLRSGASGGFPIAGHIETMMSSQRVTLGIDTSDIDEIQTYSDGPHSSLNSLKENCDWRQRETMAWYKKFNTDGLAPNGSFPRPWGVLLNNMHEVILVFQKPGKRDFDDMDEEIIERSEINKRDNDMCDDVWIISPENWSPKHTDENMPVFPEKLVRRAIRLWSYEGDTVLDPFAGRFTVGKVAKQERRHGVGYELREDLEQDIERYTLKNQSGLYQFVEND